MTRPYRDVFSTAVEFSCACVQPPVLFDAFMFHPSGTDTQPGADGLINLNRLMTANKPRKKLIGQCTKIKMSIYELYRRRRSTDSHPLSMLSL